MFMLQCIQTRLIHTVLHLHRASKTRIIFMGSLEEKDLIEHIDLKRKRRLSDTDWTQLQDVPLSTRDKWKAYRQALRDITTQPGYPKNVKWPLKPV